MCMMPNLYHWLSTLSRSTSPNLPTEHEETIEQLSLAEMNNLLQILAGVFPEHQVSLLRELLLEASPESRLSIAANALIQNPKLYSQKATRLPSAPLEEWEIFRSTKYRATVEKLLMDEFQGLAKSTVRNIVSEHNGDYVRSREALIFVASQSWRFNLTAWLSRKLKPPPRPHIDITKSSTGCVRLDEEIFALGRPDRDAQSSKDKLLARSMNEEEYAQAQALLECECCFGDFTWEDITACTKGHFFCHNCLDRSVKEALYGQGGCLFREKGSVHCISSVASSACQGFVTSALLSQALPTETFERLEERLARDQLQSSGLKLVGCPACTYAAVDTSTSPRLRPVAVGPLAVLGILAVRHLPRYLLVFSTFYLSIYALWYGVQNHAYDIHIGISRTWVVDAMARVRRRRAGVPKLFKCENPRCRIQTCIDCGKEWTAFHNCRRDALDSQRLYIERAMSEAVKRTCPKCGTSFVKSAGCNLLTCPCGYEMCYLCRADVRGVRYKHFCQHFRLEPGKPCTECDRCNLYEVEDEDAVANAAARRAAQEWLEKRSSAGRIDDGPVTELPAGSWRHTDNKWLFWLEFGLECTIELLFEW